MFWHARHLLDILYTLRGSQNRHMLGHGSLTWALVSVKAQIPT